MSSREEELRAQRNAAAGSGGFLYTVIVICAIMFAVNRNRNASWGSAIGAMFMALFASPIYLTYATASCFLKAKRDGTPFLQSTCFDFGSSA